MPRPWVLAGVVLGCCACGGPPMHPEWCAPPAPPAVRVALPIGPVPCPTAAELAQIDLPVTIEGDAGPLVCHAANGSADLTQVQKTVYQALLFMFNARFDAPLPWTNRTLWQWFRVAVNGIRVRSDLRVNFCCEPTGVINLLHPTQESTIPFGLLAMMVHEGRHAEGRPHTCDVYDHRISDMGAFGVQYSLYRWIGLHLPSATQAEREYALNAADLLRSSGAFCSECAE